MGEAIIISLISGGISIFTTLITAYFGINKILNAIKIEQAITKEKIKVINHRIGDLENAIKIQRLA